MGTPENGELTNRIAAESQTAETMAEYLHGWQERYPKAVVPEQRPPLSREEIDQLKAIGYLD